VSLTNRIADIARTAVGADTTDLPKIIRLQEGLLELSKDGGLPSEEVIGGVINHAAESLGSIVMRDIDNAEAALSEVNRILDYLQLVAETLEQGGDVSTLSPPALGQAADTGAPSEPADAVPENTAAEDDANEAENSAADEAAEATSDEPVAEVSPVSEADTSADTPEKQPIEIDLDEPDVEPEPEPVSEAPAEPASAASSDDRVIIECEMDDTLREFIGEAVEHLQNSEEALLQLESDPTDADLINVVFRAFHTIKGVAGFLNLQAIVELAHVAEYLLDAARSNTVDVTPRFIELVLRATDVLGELVAAFEGGEPPLRSTYDKLIAELDHALKHGVDDDAPAAAPEPAASEPEASPAPAPAEGPAAEHAEPVASQPAPEPEPKIQPAPVASAPAAQPAGGAPQGEANKPAPPAKNNKRAAADHTVKVNTQRLDGLVDMVGELVISHQMMVQDPAISSLEEQRTHRTLGQVGKIIRDLQELAMSLRMVTLRGSFQKMTRLVRDLSKKAGKTIAIEIEGEDTELDRNVVEEIGDPLVHMVRNACDHGIESPEQRKAVGKPEQGTLTLRASHKGGSIVIEVQDDGKGLDREKLIAKALERGVLTSNDNPAEMSDSEVYQLIFAPGFSTADKVTDISGRGVGMDVVRRNIEALRGSIEIRSEKGKGSTFVLSLPLTMAIIDGMVVRIGEDRFVVPTLSIERSFRPQAEQISTVMGNSRMVSVRGSMLPVFQFGGLFGVAEPERDLQDALVVVLEANNSRMCLVVDEILGQQQVVIKSLGESIGRIKGVSGAAILGDGRVALILDVGGLFTQADDYTQTVAHAA